MRKTHCRCGKKLLILTSAHVISGGGGGLVLFSWSGVIVLETKTTGDDARAI